MKLIKTYDYNGKHFGYVNRVFIRTVSIIREDPNKYFAEAFVEDGLTKTIFVGNSFESCVAFIESLDAERAEVPRG